MVIDGYGELCFSLRSAPPPHRPALPVVDAQNGQGIGQGGKDEHTHDHAGDLADAAGEGDVTIVPGVGRIIKAVPLFLCDVPLCKVGSLDMGQVFFDVQDQFQLLRSVVPPSTVIFLSVMRLPRLSTSPWNSSMRLRINQPPPRRRPGAAAPAGGDGERLAWLAPQVYTGHSAINSIPQSTAAAAQRQCPGYLPLAQIRLRGLGQLLPLHWFKEILNGVA